ncbi:MAG: hypothetical protein KKD67_00005 [Proteobacteria bacterium]|nr:hypothetical protein [Pseudomonadota bacterium]
MICFQNEHGGCNHTEQLRLDKEFDWIFKSRQMQYQSKTGQKAEYFIDMVKDGTSFLQSNSKIKSCCLLLYTKGPKLRASTRLM